MSAKSRWIRNARTHEVIASDAHSVTLKIMNGVTGECVKVELGFQQIANCNRMIRDVADREARVLEERAAIIRKNVLLRERKFAEGGQSCS